MSELLDAGICVLIVCSGSILLMSTRQVLRGLRNGVCTSNRRGDGVYHDGWTWKQGILAAQEYSLADLNASSTVPFTNVLDKTYGWSVADQQKRQCVLKPFFAKSDQQLSMEEVIPSAAITTDRGGNERATTVCKRSGLLQRGRLEGAVGRLINLTMLG
mmetsp:Transcript_1896/g.2956  ORF Transcript_1896/g.2956 Transcript_1896/m.2956 type:complete len:159 (+) Transcript_1896:366-842(+)